MYQMFSQERALNLIVPEIPLSSCERASVMNRFLPLIQKKIAPVKASTTNRRCNRLNECEINPDLNI